MDEVKVAIKIHDMKHVQKFINLSNLTFLHIK